MKGLDGPAAPPRANGELVFDAPWESRVFGLTLALSEAGHFDFEEFRTLLIEEIGAWEAAHPQATDLGSEGWSYYERWSRALERLLAAKELCPAADLEERRAQLAARPAGHDHG